MMGNSSLLIAVLPALLFSYAFVSQLLHHSVTFPESIPVVGVRKQAFKRLRASFRQLTHGIKTLSEGYSKVRNTRLDDET